MKQARIQNRNQTFIKICGLTNPHEAKECVKLGAHAVGIVFFKKSPRNMSLEAAEKLCSILPDKTLTTGVFVNESYDFIMKAADLCRLKAVQLHGSESPGLVRSIAGNGIKVIKAVFEKQAPLINRVNIYEHAWAYLVEKGHGKLPGGTAQKWSWRIDRTIFSDKRIIIAGGLAPSNVERAVKVSGAFGVDVSSGVESSPGIKDLDKVKKFIEKAAARP